MRYRPDLLAALAGQAVADAFGLDLQDTATKRQTKFLLKTWSVTRRL